ncbi:hypothetical protein [Cellvibrio sp. PSBB006]|uniref:hypothetical protein n=1 Tax=Cellvibrio sp. PSBB006 TaxID=1987723 RepID=UPI000B3B7D4D|nr:hypothetical protein [Cellvibrio sp. PSBB006]ARU29441.1 hypothetical protein CBR65_19470 [Cellvibrio sp. PSBB006]
MNDKKLILGLEYLINKYIQDDSYKVLLVEEINREDFHGAKGILHEIRKNGSEIDSDDLKIIKEIIFNYG